MNDVIFGSYASRMLAFSLRHYHEGNGLGFRFDPKQLGLDDGFGHALEVADRMINYDFFAHMYLFRFVVCLLHRGLDDRNHHTKGEKE